MDDVQPEHKKEYRRALVRAALPAIAAYGLGYGIARTALEKFEGDLSPGVMRYAPVVLGGVAAYAGRKADEAAHEYALARAKARSR